MIEEEIRKTIKASIDEYFTPSPVYLNKKQIAQYIGVSVSTIDRLVASDVLKRDIHYASINSQTMYYVKAVVDELMPRGYNAYIHQREKEKNIPKLQV